MNKHKDKSTRRAWLSWSTRRLLVLIALLSIPLWWLRNRIAAARRQEIAVQHLESLGRLSKVGYLHEWDYERNRSHGLEVPNPGPQFLRSVVGDHFFLTPNVYILTEFAGFAAELRPLEELTTLTDVGIVDSPALGDELVSILTRLPRLKHVSLYGTRVSYTGVVRLKACPQLESLVVSQTLVSAEEVALLEQVLPHCEIIWDNEQEP